MTETSFPHSTRQDLRDLYLADQRAWVVAFSGGKDSTAVLQLVCETLMELGSRARKPVYVISSDTGVEAPVVVTYLETVLAAVDTWAASALPMLRTTLVRPRIAERFWPKLIGLGYPPPTRWFRWCTTTMKIKPCRRAIEEISREFGSVACCSAHAPPKAATAAAI